MELTANLDMQVILRSHNLVKELDHQMVEALGARAVTEFRLDKGSRADWEEKMKTALKLALQIVEKKTFPWPDAANVKFPLLTIAALQFHARAYPALINGSTPVTCRPMLPYPDIPQLPQVPPEQQQSPEYKKAVQQLQQMSQQALNAYQKEVKRAKRVSEHMSYQILEEDEQWEEEQDRALLIMSILGCAFKKTYHDPLLGHNRSECISPQDFVTSYYTKDLETSPRYSHIIYLSRNAIRERQVRGIFAEFTHEAPAPVPEFKQDAVENIRQGVSIPGDDLDAPYECIEQYRWLDLDGDGYKEPYIVTVRLDTEQVLRIVARFTRANILYTDDDKNPKIARITAMGIFTKYGFIPSPDGGFYDLGFGCLLGPINQSIDTAINQLLDAGSLSNAGGGFLGRGFKSKKGDLRFRLNEWKQVDCTGDDLRKSVFPMPTREPSATLFNLLSLLIEYGQQVAGAADILQGKNPGQNTPAETSRTMVEQGMKIFNGIYKRVHRAFTQEIRKMYKLNSVFLDDTSTYYSSRGQQSVKVFKADYGHKGTEIRPAADPFYMSDTQRAQTAAVLCERASHAPGYNLYAVEKKFLESLKIDNIDEIYPDPKGPNAVPPKKDPKVQIEEMRAQIKEKELKLKEADQKMQQKQAEIEIALEVQKTQAEIAEIQSNIQLAKAQAQSDQVGHQIAMMQMQMQAKQQKMEGFLKALEITQKFMAQKEKESEQRPDNAG